MAFPQGSPLPAGGKAAEGPLLSVSLQHTPRLRPPSCLQITPPRRGRTCGSGHACTHPLNVHTQNMLPQPSLLSSLCPLSLWPLCAQAPGQTAVSLLLGHRPSLSPGVFVSGVCLACGSCTGVNARLSCCGHLQRQAALGLACCASCGQSHQHPALFTCPLGLPQPDSVAGNTSRPEGHGASANSHPISSLRTNTRPSLPAAWSTDQCGQRGAQWGRGQREAKTENTDAQNTSSLPTRVSDPKSTAA